MNESANGSIKGRLSSQKAILEHGHDVEDTLPNTLFRASICGREKRQDKFHMLTLEESKEVDSYCFRIPSLRHSRRLPVARESNMGNFCFEP
jgi:hypothetical protein